jgi:hypothetical protein
LDDVPWHNHFRRYDLQPAVTKDERARGLQQQQALHGTPGPPLGGKSQRGVDDQHDGDGERLEMIANQERQQNGGSQQADDHAAELVAENDESRHAGG